jgi:hypothetical protein
MATVGAVYDAWVAKYGKVSGFNPENPTPEQSLDFHEMYSEAVDGKKLVSYSPELLDNLMKLPEYSIDPADN